MFHALLKINVKHNVVKIAAKAITRWCIIRTEQIKKKKKVVRYHLSRAESTELFMALIKKVDNF